MPRCANDTTFLPVVRSHNPIPVASPHTARNCPLGCHARRGSITLSSGNSSDSSPLSQSIICTLEVPQTATRRVAGWKINCDRECPFPSERTTLPVAASTSRIPACGSSYAACAVGREGEIPGARYFPDNFRLAHVYSPDFRLTVANCRRVASIARKDGSDGNGALHAPPQLAIGQAIAAERFVFRGHDIAVGGSGHIAAITPRGPTPQLAHGAKIGQYHRRQHGVPQLQLALIAAADLIEQSDGPVDGLESRESLSHLATAVAGGRLAEIGVPQSKLG